MQEHLTRAELIVVLLLASYGGVIGAMMAVAYALARST